VRRAPVARNEGIVDAITAGRSLEQALDGLAHLLVEHGQCDLKTLDRARRVAAESGQRLDSVMIQLGLVSERGLAEAYAALLGTRLVTPDRYPDEPLFAERLTTRFLRSARAMPIALAGEALLVAATDPLDPFTAAAIAAATGRRRRARRRAAGGGRRAAEGSGQRGAGDPPRQPDDLARRRDPRQRHPYRAVRGPAADPLQV
jgi:general secretion pathway protein E